MITVATEENQRCRNHYRHCGQEWEDVWSCMCNDRCPVCNREIEPHASDDLAEDEEENTLHTIA